jgi:hypothetical protein
MTKASRQPIQAGSRIRVSVRRPGGFVQVVLYQGPKQAGGLLSSIGRRPVDLSRRLNSLSTGFFEHFAFAYGILVREGILLLVAASVTAKCIDKAAFWLLPSGSVALGNSD